LLINRISNSKTATPIARYKNKQTSIMPISLGKLGFLGFLGFF
jgi:hypothetical protein